MKKSKAIKEIVKVLQSWESSKLNKKCAEDILAKLEELGMNPPPTMTQDADGIYSIPNWNWDENRGRMSKYFICDKCAKKKKFIFPKWPVTCTTGLCGWCKRKDESSLTPVCDFDTPNKQVVWD